MLPLHPIWPPLDIPFGHNLVNAWPILYMCVNIRFYLGLAVHEGGICDNIQRFNEITAEFKQM